MTDQDRELLAGLATLLADERCDRAHRIEVLRTVADAAEALGHPPCCHVVPFMPGRRPTDEARHPGLGSSDSAAMVTGQRAQPNEAIVLFDAGDCPTSDPRLEIHATVRLAERDGTSPGKPLRRWNHTTVALDDERRVQSLSFASERDFPLAQLGFEHCFLRRALVDLTATWDGTAVASDRAELEVCDVRNLGSLYRRVLDGVVAVDTARQASAASVSNPGTAYHPWFPVLLIGTDKASLYTRALVADIVGKECNLTDPAWLLRVGVYLELLTCLGIFEAVKSDVGDLLSAAEREAYESSPVFGDIRSHVDVAAWRGVWRLREIAFSRPVCPRAGPVSAANLMQKKRATLAFLEVHHEDLKHAIELAGENRHNAQEAWHRVFRDAERAVVRKTSEAFPELAHLPSPMRDVVLWNQLDLGGHQGLYATACTQYRASMNSVARWAKQRGLIDYTGEECIPTRVSLLDAHKHNPERVAVLQRGDGYVGATLDGLANVTPAPSHDNAHAPPTADFEALLSKVPILQMLSRSDLRVLAAEARPLLLMRAERIVIQGAPGSSLFIVADGKVEVVRRHDGVDSHVDTMGPGAVFGEMALLTGEKRNATVRAVDTALVFEIGAQQYRPLINAHPEWLDELADMMSERISRDRQRAEAAGRRSPRTAVKSVHGIRDRIIGHLFG